MIDDMEPMIWAAPAPRRRRAHRNVTARRGVLAARDAIGDAVGAAEEALLLLCGEGGGGCVVAGS